MSSSTPTHRPVSRSGARSSRQHRCGEPVAANAVVSRHRPDPGHEPRPQPRPSSSCRSTGARGSGTGGGVNGPHSTPSQNRWWRRWSTSRYQPTGRVVTRPAYNCRAAPPPVAQPRLVLPASATGCAPTSGTTFPATCGTALLLNTVQDHSRYPVRGGPSPWWDACVQQLTSGATTTVRRTPAGPATMCTAARAPRMQQPGLFAACARGSARLGPLSPRRGRDAPGAGGPGGPRAGPPSRSRLRSPRGSRRGRGSPPASSPHRPSTSRRWPQSRSRRR